MSQSGRPTFLLSVICFALTPSTSRAVEPIEAALPTAAIVSRAPHERVWERTVETVLPNGRVLREISGYTELATGICRRNELGEFIDASPTIEIIGNNPVARQTQHQVIFPTGITTDAIDLLMPNGQQRLRIVIRGLSYYDPATGRNVLITEMRPSTAVVSGATVTYPNCFTGIKGSVIYRNTLSSFSQEILIEAQIPPPAAFQLPDTCRLEAYSEVLEAPVPQITQKTTRSRHQGADATDDTIDFTSLLIGRGKAYLLNEDAFGSVPVSKSWITIDQRLWLIESCEYLSIKPHLDALPVTAAVQKPKQTSIAALARRIMPNKQFTKPGGDRPQMAMIPPRHSGLLLDYEAVNTGTNVTFRAGRTYLVNGPVNLYHSAPVPGLPSATFEPNCVIKYARTNNASINFYATPKFLSTNYQRIYCTALDDNSVGETINGSTGSPAGNYYGNPAFWGGSIEDYHHTWFAYANTAISLEDNHPTVRHCQFIHCNTACSALYGWWLALDNCLFYDISTVFQGDQLIVDARHLTVNGCNNLTSGTGSFINLTNTLLIGVTYDGGFTFATNAVARATTSSGIFTNVGGSAHYLAPGSTNRNAGTTNIGSSLLAELRKLTTYPPAVIQPTNFLYTNMSLFPITPRDTDTPDIGYHFDVIDFCLGSAAFSNSTVTVYPGTALATFAASSASYGLAPFYGTTLVMEGNPTSTVKVVRFNAVQEQATTNWSALRVPSILGPWQGLPGPTARFRFTEFSTPGRDTPHIDTYTYGYVMQKMNFVDCRFHGGRFQLGCTANVTNCLFEGSAVVLGDTYGDIDLNFQNNLFYWTTNDLEHYYIGTWKFRDNFFDHCGISGDTVDADYNGYVTNTTRLPGSGSHDVILSTNIVWQTGPMGNYYTPTNSGLRDKGSASADSIGLFHFTSVADQLIEGRSIIDIGLHFPQVSGTNFILSTNMAFSQVVTQSSTWPGGDATYAIDGNTGGNFSTDHTAHTLLDAQAWWQIDLGSIRPIEIIRLWNRTDCCPERLNNSWVLVSDSAFSSTNLASTTNQAGVGSYYIAGFTNSLTLPIYRTGRYVRIQLAGTNYLSLAEVQIMSASFGSDIDGDLIWTYAEDVNGNGIQDIGETDWQTADSEFISPSEPLGPCSRRTPLVISEIMYNPIASGGQDEFIEIYNSHHLAQDLSGYSLKIGPNTAFVFPTNSTSIIEPGAFLIVVRDASNYPSVTNKIGTSTQNLPNNGPGEITLLNQSGAVLLSFKYDCDPPWPASADGTGHSLVLYRPSYGEGDPRAWKASARIGGSPGSAEPTAVYQTDLVKINEFLANPTNGEPQFIELYNESRFPVDLSGWFLSGRNNHLKDFIIPEGTFLLPRGFVSFKQGTNSGQFSRPLGPGGDKIYLTAQDETRVIDSVLFKTQDLGISSGRSPDGSPVVQELSSRSPAASNTNRLRRDIVINEIMFNPISGIDEDDEFVELYNRGSSSVNLNGWKLSGGPSFTFPNIAINSSNFLVIAKNTNRVATNYNLVVGTSLIGPFSGDLGNRGDRVTLTTNDIVIDEVVYQDGGRWGKWADGGGSSLELIENRSERRLPSNWEDSDETAKSANNWTLIENTGYLDLGFTNASGIEIYLDDAGECLIDEVKVLQNNSNYVSNSSFNSGIAGWVGQGTHNQILWETTAGYSSNKSLRLLATGRGDLGANRLRSSLSANLAVGGANSATLSARVRWLRGTPNIILRLHGNYLEAVGRMIVPTNLGSPGLPNSRSLANTGPAITDVTHWPVLPRASQIVRVSARIDDPDGIASASLKYRIDPSTTVSSVTMRDDGSDGDLIANDGIYSASMPSQPSGALAAFYIEASDGFAQHATNSFPNDAPTRECLVRFGETQPSGTFGTYRIWFTQTNATKWATRDRLNNDPLDVTFVSGANRVIYNANAIFSGSSFTSSYYDTPTGALCGYALGFPDDDAFLGATSVGLDWPARDQTAQREQVAYWIASKLNLHYNHRRFVHLIVNGVSEATRPLPFGAGTQIYEDAQQPNSDELDEWFPKKTQGNLYKFDVWEEFSYTSNAIEYPSAQLPKMGLFWTTNITTSLPEKKLPRYRAYYRERAVKNGSDNLTNLLALVDALNTTNTGDAYTTTITNLIDTEQWMRVFALQDVCDNVDTFGNNWGKNMFAYKATSTNGWRLLLWDYDYGLGETLSCEPELSDSLFHTYDPVIRTLQMHPPFQREYWRAIQDAVNGPMLAANIEPIMDANYTALIANGVTVQNPGSVGSYDCTTNYTVKTWVSRRRTVLTNELAKVTAPFAITNGPNSTVSNIVLGGTAPMEIKFIRLDNRTTNEPISWPTVTNWSLPFVLTNGPNTITAKGYDPQTNFLSWASNTVTITNTP